MPILSVSTGHKKGAAEVGFVVAHREFVASPERKQLARLQDRLLSSGSHTSTSGKSLSSGREARDVLKITPLQLWVRHSGCLWFVLGAIFFLPHRALTRQQLLPLAWNKL